MSQLGSSTSAVISGYDCGDRQAFQNKLLLRLIDGPAVREA
ncbi:hypothetical protein [Cyanobium sp. BA20m-14]|nr:hypothetical protein [Cyanobium sp. BA20m-14]